MEPTKDTIPAFSPDAKISKELKNVLIAFNQEHEIIKQTIAEVAQSKGYKNELNGNSQKANFRDFIDMVEPDARLSEEEVREKAAQLAEDYMSDDPELRKNRLKEFLDRIDAVDITGLDYSCLTGHDMGERTEPYNLTPSERDVLTLLTIARADQAVAVKLLENPNYLKERYLDEKDRFLFELKQELLITKGFSNYFSNVLLPNNGLSAGFAPLEAIPNDHVRDAMALSPAFGAFVYSQSKAALYDQPAKESLQFKFPDSLGRELNGIVTQKKLTSTQKNFVLNAFDRTFGVLTGNKFAKEYMADAGLSQEDMIFIDGESLAEKMQKEYPNLTGYQRTDTAKHLTIQAMLSGQHRVEVASLQRNGKDSYSFQIAAMEADLHAMDRYELQEEHSAFRRAFNFGLTKIKTRADRADELWKKDPERIKRHKDIQDSVFKQMNASIDAKEAPGRREQERVRMKESVDRREQSIHNNDLAFFGWILNGNRPDNYTPEISEALNKAVPEALTAAISKGTLEALGFNQSAETYSPVGTFERSDSRGSVVSLYAMLHGMSMEDVLSTDPALNQKKEEIGRSFIEEFKILGEDEFHQKNGADADYKAYFEAKNKNIYGLYRQFEEFLGNMSIEPFMQNTMEGLIKNYTKIDFINSCVQNAMQTPADDIKDMWGKENYRALSRKLGRVADVGNNIGLYCKFIASQSYAAPDFDDKDACKDIGIAVATKTNMKDFQEHCSGFRTIEEMHQYIGQDWIDRSRTLFGHAGGYCRQNPEIARDGMRYVLTGENPIHSFGEDSFHVTIATAAEIRSLKKEEQHVERRRIDANRFVNTAGENRNVNLSQPQARSHGRENQKSNSK